MCICPSNLVSQVLKNVVVGINVCSLRFLLSFIYIVYIYIYIYIYIAGL